MSCLIASTALLAAPSSARAADDVGGLLGFTWGNNNVGGHLAWGLTGHVMLMPNIQLGDYLSEFGNDRTQPGGATFTDHYWTIAAEGNYLLNGLVDGAWVGAKAGVEITTHSEVGATNGTDLVLGPALGYDYPLGSGLSVGGQFNILWVTSSPGETLTSLFGVVKYSFF